MLKNFFIPNPENNYYSHGIRPKALYGYLVFMILFNVFATRFILYIPVKATAQVQFTISDILALTNQDRQSNKLSGLNENQVLEKAAEAKAADMLKYQYWAHNNPTTGTTPWNFISNAGYNYKYAGENLAEGFTSAADINSAWMNSSEHRDNILNRNYAEIGIAIESGNFLGSNNTLVVQMFGTQQPSITPTQQPATIHPDPVISTTAAIIQPTRIQQKPVITKPFPTKPVAPSKPVLTPTLALTTGSLTTPTASLPPEVTVIKPTQIRQSVLSKQTSSIVSRPSGIIDNIKYKIEGISFVNGVNLFMGLFLLALFILDSIYYYKVKEIHARNKPSSMAHIPLLIILSIICLTSLTGLVL